ncbi:EAL domain-containing protein [Algicella marina]|uniref:EAL domain-containing protein n=1 Tax=Algicella marina TaxID=2683284 RepID=A0A6P1T5S0_9RHOB|nr:EAL domain-containing protein [Algicella marina]QHQ37043.1 EAL domain-containing protein [Algicella marina]
METPNRRKERWKPVASCLPQMAQVSGKMDTEVCAFVRHALRDGRVRLAYQPVVSSRANRRVAFHEALVRLTTESGTEVPPGAFLQAIVGTGLAAEMDRAVLRRVLAELEFDPALRLSVNIHPETICDEGWRGILRHAVALRPELGFRLIVEVSEETSLTNNPQAVDFLGFLAQRGVSLALDDFGAGATSLRDLRVFRFDFLKIDGSLCRGLADDDGLQCMVAAIVDIARHHDLVTVAEFISREADAEMAARLGVDCLQGACFGLSVSLSKEMGQTGTGKGQEQRHA